MSKQFATVTDAAGNVWTCVSQGPLEVYAMADVKKGEQKKPPALNPDAKPIPVPGEDPNPESPKSDKSAEPKPEDLPENRPRRET